MDDVIKSELKRIESEHAVRVLYACESGSRAWGFASPDSDWDVRFVYVHGPDWYLSILDHRDVIEEMLPNDLDISGWDLRKALQLARKSNPAFFEWLQSPIVYQQDEAFMVDLRRCLLSYYSPSKCLLHYLHMAVGNFKENLQGPEVKLKKYLYVLRPLFACLWLERGLAGDSRYRGQVPMEFDHLRRETVLDPGFQHALDGLLELKSRSGELASGPRIEAISTFIERELPRLQAAAPNTEPVPDPEALDRIFRETVLAI